MATHTQYHMIKWGWDTRLGTYSNAEIQAGPLTLAQVRGRVARLPDSTRWLWTVQAHQFDDRTQARTIMGSINADEFDGDVPRIVPLERY